MPKRRRSWMLSGVPNACGLKSDGPRSSAAGVMEANPTDHRLSEWPPDMASWPVPTRRPRSSSPG
eukprot:scaffold3348_cov113-Isochrysis_galbana.AAC.5